MAEETLITASRRVVNYIGIDDTRHGGLISRETIEAVRILDYELRQEMSRHRADGTPIEPECKG